MGAVEPSDVALVTGRELMKRGVKPIVAKKLMRYVFGKVRAVDSEE
jgi:hypothetical protein